MDECSEQDKMINEEYENLAAQREQQIKRNALACKNEEIWTDANYQPKKFTSSNRHNLNMYADKLLMHLVIEEEFDFGKISQIMTYTFKYENKLYSEQICRQRWFQLHRDRQIYPLMKGKYMKLTNGPSQEQENGEQNIQARQTSQTQLSKEPMYLDFKNHGYNIFKDSIRKIDDLQKHNQLRKQMKTALQKASQSIELEKPMLYTPYYERLQQFQVLQQELTLQKMQQMMSHPIEMELMERELQVLDLNQRNYESKVKRDFTKKARQDKIINQEEFQIEQNWDEYESD